MDGHGCERVRWDIDRRHDARVHRGVGGSRRVRVRDVVRHVVPGRGERGRSVRVPDELDDTGAVFQAQFPTAAFPLNQWVHVAVVRRASPSGFTLYANGTAVTLNVYGNVATKPTSDPGTTMFLGCTDDMNQNLQNVNGNMQDVRFYTTAKYTQNFTVA
jgi:hypothetical protein